MAGDGDERVGADVERQPEAVAARVDEAAPEVVAVGERDAVDDEVEPAELRAGAFERGGDVVVRRDIALDERGVLPVRDELGDVALHALVLVGHREPGAGLVERPGYGPGDAAAVRDPEDYSGLSTKIDRVHFFLSSLGAVLVSGGCWVPPRVLSHRSCGPSS